MTTSRWRSSAPDVSVTVDRVSATPLASQIAGQLRDAVIAGVLTAGDRLPSTRDLAATLAVSRTVVTSAYTQLFAEGWLEGHHGSGTFVADVAPAQAVVTKPPPRSSYAAASSSCPPDSTPSSPGVPGLIELLPGVPWTAGIDPASWRRAWRAAGRGPVRQLPDPFGVPELRRELAGFLRRSRGLAVTPDQVLVTRGVSSGLAMLTAALIRPGDRVGFEEPGYQRAREVLERAGATVLPCPVDSHGIIPDALPGNLRLVYTTPAHQYPLGGRLPIRRRQALAAWARASGAVIAEDDYDGEFRYDVGPLPTLRGIAPDVIAYLGTASKMLTQTLGVGWLIADPDLVARLAAARDSLGERVSEPAQQAMAALLASGDLERHIRRARLEYARRRAALLDGLGDGDGRFRLLGETAGLHVVLELPPGQTADVASRARDLGVAVATLEQYFAGPVTTQGLILGYGATPLSQVRRAAAILRGLLLADSAAPTRRSRF